MGTNWSQETHEDSSSEQAQQSSHLSYKPIRNNITTTNVNISDINDEVKLPHNFEAIIKESDLPIDRSSPKKLYQQLSTGIYLNGRRKKFWVEKKGNMNINFFMVLANGLSITWSEDQNYWYFHDIQTSEGKLTVAELRNVCWLEVHGKFNTSNLSPGIVYEVAFVIKLEFSSYGWKVPVNLRLTLPNGSKQQHQENLKEKPLGEWILIPVGQFKTSPENVGEIEFSLFEYEGGNWKKGLVIKGATIQPKF